MAKPVERKKLFYAIPAYFPNWDLEKYPSRMGIGMNLNDYRGLEMPIYRFIHKDIIYKITKEKAFETKVDVPFSQVFPHAIPLEAFEIEKGVKQNGE